MIYDITNRLKEACEFYDDLLDRKLSHISELSGVPIEKMKKINPAEFIAKNKWQKVEGFTYTKVWDWLAENKTDDTYCISPVDDDIKTADQIAYKEKVGTVRIRASKCQLLPINSEVAADFYLRNHRQVLPKFTHLAINYGLIYKGELVGAMTYDKTGGAVRGSSKAEKYELLRLAFAKKISIAGGASKLQKHCEEAMRHYDEHSIFSYSNATINSGKVYEALGFNGEKVYGGQPFVIMENNRLVRLVNLFPYSTDKALAVNGRIKTHLGGNRLWTKEI